MRGKGEPLTATLVRHGKTEGNIKLQYVGHIDLPLAPEGREELLQRRESGVYPPVEAVFTSPLTRCVQTASLLYPHRDAVVIDGLMERDFGDYEGKTYDEIRALPGNGGWGEDAASMVFPGGEPPQAFYDRCCAAFWEGADSCAAAGVRAAAFVVHGGVIMAVMMRHALPPKDYYDWMCKNARGYVVSCDTHSRTLTVIKTLGD